MKKITLTTTITAILMISLTAITSCKKKYDAPPAHVIPESSRLTISQVKALLTGTTYKFTSDANLYCMVIADETTGSFYKESYVRDATGALHINLLSSGGLYIGDSIRINLKGTVLQKNQGNFEIDSVNVDNMVTKQVTGLHPQPVVTTLAALTNTATNANLSGQLIQLQGVEFVSADKNKTYAYPLTQTSENRTLTACGSPTNVVIYTSGYANFAGQITPSGSGNVTAIMTLYSNKPELILRSSTEVSMTGPACPSPTYAIGSPVMSINETFSTVTNNAVFSSTGWLNIAEAGTVKWKGYVSGGTMSVKATSFGSGESSNAMWLITPPIVYTNTMTLSFSTGYSFWVPSHPNPIMAYVSTNFDGTNFATANWTAVSTAAYSSGTGSSYPTGITPSGTINLNSISILSGYSGNFFVAFKYTGNQTYTSNLYLDDIIVQ